MKNFSIRAKLIIIFILIKVLPLLLITYIAIQGVLMLEMYFTKNTIEVFNHNKKIINDTAKEAINDSIVMLDKKSQLSIEKLSYQIAQNVAAFLYERDKDILFLSHLPLNETTFKNFYAHKNKPITIHESYIYNDARAQWVSTNTTIIKSPEANSSNLKDNNKEFHYTNPIQFEHKNIPLYKEVVFFDLKGIEKYKVSSISSDKKDISKQKNTYIKAETYFKHIQTLQKGEIYVSDVIGAYVHSNVIGNFSKEKASKMGIAFEPKKHGYAGIENPVGKKFDGIIRFITPYYKNGVKIGYISLALDHQHIMEYTDTVDPINSNMKQNIANAAVGNYAFMWDYEGKNISHPRDYFIYGYDPKTGKSVTPWLSQDVNEKFKQSKDQDIHTFLENYPQFEAQSLEKKPNLAQLKNDGNISLDCRYLNFAPQCTGWMEVTQDGGYGSFIIYWSNVWKLTTAATIPYYTGQYGNSKRGFGFVTIGANVDEFHKAAMQTKDKVDTILEHQTQKMLETLEHSNQNITMYIQKIVNELTITTFIMIIIVISIAIMMSKFITSKIQNLLQATQRFSNKDYEHKIDVHSNDEIGQLEHSFNNMTTKVSTLIKEQEELNSSLEKRIEEAIKKTEHNERTIREKDNILAQQSKMAALGEMLENIAHQWRQPLSAISTASSGLKIKSSLDMVKEKEIHETLDEITNQTKYLSNTIDDFRNFFKTDKPIDTFKVNETIDKTLNIISSKFEDLDINIVKELQEVEITTYENELIQVLINLFNNSKDEFIERDVRKPHIFISLYTDQDHVYIETKDNAKGINPKILERIFEPYFTTKHKMQGTGIGLHMSREIIMKHMKGSIEVHNTSFTYNNQSFTGAKFLIKIPLVNKYHSDFSI